MSDSELPDSDTVSDALHAKLRETGGVADPYRTLESEVREYERDVLDAFDAYVAIELEDSAPKTIKSYERSFRYWREFMETGTDRHPACFDGAHPSQFADYLHSELDHDGPAIAKRLRHLSKAHQFWIRKFPHSGVTKDGGEFRPFDDALEDVDASYTGPSKQQRMLSVSILRKQLDSMTHIRDLAILTTQLKLGLRAGAVRNLQLRDISINHPDVRDHYPELGTHSGLKDPVTDETYENAIYVAPSTRNDYDLEGREGNKSRIPRVLPLDSETRQILLKYLLIRPDTGSPWLFLSKENHLQLYDTKAIRRIWEDAFHPNYAETEEYRAITSHYGRHRLTTHLRKNEVSPDYIKYIRGDKYAEDVNSSDSMKDYIHTQYTSVRPAYLENIYTLDVST